MDYKITWIGPKEPKNILISILVNNQVIIQGRCAYGQMFSGETKRWVIEQMQKHRLGEVEITFEHQKD